MGTSYCCPKCDARRGPWIQKVRRRHVRRMEKAETFAQWDEETDWPEAKWRASLEAEDAEVSLWDLVWIWPSAWNWAHPDEPFEGTIEDGWGNLWYRWTDDED